MAGIIIRHATKKDVPYIIKIEERLFAHTGCTPFGEEHAQCWLETHPDGFLVAENSDQIVAFTYMQIIDFDPNIAFPVKSYNELTDHGYSRSTHNPAGNAFCTITMDSCSPISGVRLFKNAMKLVAERKKKYGVGTSRISGFKSYLDNLHKLGIINKELIEKQALMHIAGWYATQTVKKTKSRIDKIFPIIPNLELPIPERADPILGFYTGNGLSVHSIHGDFLHDPESYDISIITYFETAVKK